MMRSDVFDSLQTNSSRTNVLSCNFKSGKYLCGKKFELENIFIATNGLTRGSMAWQKLGKSHSISSGGI